MELNNKEKIIKSLNMEINKYRNQYKNFMEVNVLSQNQSEQLQQQLQKLVNEKNDLIKENTNFKNKIIYVTKQMKNAINLQKSKAQQNNMQISKERNALYGKLNEYKQKVIILKKKVNELYAIIERLKNSKYQTNSHNSNYNNYVEIPQMPSTPSQKQKFSVMNNQGNNFYNKTPLIGLKNENVMNMNNRVNFKNGLNNDEFEIKQKKSLENYRKFLSQLDKNMPNPK